MFYPADPAGLRSAVETYLEQNRKEAPTPKAIIAPHAGYIYSGPVAASAYSTLAPLRGKIHRVVLLGPAHRVAINGIASVSTDFFETPLGRLKVDLDTLHQLERFDFVNPLDLAHRDEHCLEVQLPFIQMTLGDVEIVPLLVGQASDEQVAEVIESLWDQEDTFFVISSDLSHYHDYYTAQQMDSNTSQAILDLDNTQIGFDDACGRLPVCGMIRTAKKHHLQAAALDTRNSGDTAGDKDRVVGYGAYAFYQS
jgi:AmmeMemoRadiSam system protein B